MDPLVCLNEAQELIGQSNCREECAHSLEAYFRWRLSGGFEPPQGDNRAMHLLVRLGCVADTLSDALDHNTRK